MDVPDLSAADAWLARRTAAERKRLGQWTTPWWVVARALELLPDLDAPRVVDPACGDGRWLVGAARRWPGARLVGVDVDPAALATARTTLRASGVTAELRLADALAVGALPEADVVVGNPPWVRPQHLPRAQREDLWRRFAVATDKVDLYAFFVERCLERATRTALVLPAPWLSLSSFAALRDHVLRHGVDAVYALPPRTFDATVEAVVLVTGPAGRRRAGALGPDGVVREGPLHVGREAWSLDGPLPELPGRPLGERVRVHMGIVCGDYARYVHRGRCHEDDRPTCRGRDVQRWTIGETDLHVRYDPRDMLDRKPYVAPKHAGLFDVPRKIVVAGTTGRALRAAMDTARRFPMDSCYVVHPRDPGVDLDAVLGLLLSRPVGDWYGARYRAARVKGVELARIPVPSGGWEAIAAAARARDEDALDAAVREAYAAEAARAAGRARPGGQVPPSRGAGSRFTPT